MNIITNPSGYVAVFVFASCIGVAIAVAIALALTNPKEEDR